MKIIIGCPIYKRDWILKHWIKCILSQSLDVSDIGFVFEVSENDNETVSILEAWKSNDKRIPYFEIVARPDLPHFEHQDNGRQWTISKYANMVSLRNSLLETVRVQSPDAYLSLDSDILLTNPNTIELLFAHIKEGADAVSPLMFMTPVGTKYPSVMTWRDDDSGKAYRKDSYPIGTYFKSDVIMAAKMMSRNVYEQTSYEIHVQGEDLGWSAQCRDKGFSLYSASYIYSPHIMSQKMYSSFLSNGDARAKMYHLV